MKQDKGNSSQPRIPSELRAYFILLGIAAATFGILWLVFRIMSVTGN